MENYSSIKGNSISSYRQSSLINYLIVVKIVFQRNHRRNFRTKSNPKLGIPIEVV